MTVRNRRVLFFLILLGAGVTTAHAAGGVKIGYIGGLSGACGGVTHSARKAMEIAQQELNSDSGVLGGRVEIVWRDSMTKPDEGVRQARDLILSEGVDVLTGVCSSSVLKAVGSVARQYGVPLFSAISRDYRSMTPGGTSFVFQTRPNALMEGKALARYIAEKGWTRIATMGHDPEWARATVEVFATELNMLNPRAEVAIQLWIPIGATDLSSYITVALSESPDLVLADLFGHTTSMLFKQGNTFGLLQEANLLTSLGTGGYRLRIRAIPDGVHMWAAAPFEALTTPAAQDFVAQYRAAYDGAYPDNQAVLAYDVMHIIADAVELAGSTDAGSIRKALRSGSFFTLRDTLRMRTIDNTFSAPTYIGQMRMTDDYPFPIMTETQLVPGEITFPDWGPNLKVDPPCPPHC